MKKSKGRFSKISLYIKLCKFAQDNRLFQLIQPPPKLAQY